MDREQITAWEIAKPHVDPPSEMAREYHCPEQRRDLPIKKNLFRDCFLLKKESRVMSSGFAPLRRIDAALSLLQSLAHPSKQSRSPETVCKDSESKIVIVLEKEVLL